MVKLIGFDRFMRSEGTEKLILAFTSKTGQSVAHTRHTIFQNRLLYQVKDSLRHFIGLISESRLKGYSRYSKTKRNFAFFHRFLARLNQLRCPATLIYGTTFPGSTKIHSTSPAGCMCMGEVQKSDDQTCTSRCKNIDR